VDDVLIGVDTGLSVEMGAAAVEVSGGGERGATMEIGPRVNWSNGGRDFLFPLGERVEPDTLSGEEALGSSEATICGSSWIDERRVESASEEGRVDDVVGSK
jgi:hypothetical protein